MRREGDTAVRDRGDRAQRLDRGHRERLAERHRAHARAVVLAALFDDARALARKIDTRLGADAEVLDHALGKELGAHLLAHERHARVGGTADDLAHRHVHGVGTAVGVADHVVADLDLGRHLEGRVLVDHVGVDAGSDHQGLKDRTGLV